MPGNHHLYLPQVLIVSTLIGLIFFVRQALSCSRDIFIWFLWAHVFFGSLCLCVSVNVAAVLPPS